MKRKRISTIMALDNDGNEIIDTNDESQNDPYKAVREEYEGLYRGSIAEKDRELLRLRAREEELLSKITTPREPVTPPKTFMEDPDAAIRAMEDRINKRLEDTINPLQQQANSMAKENQLNMVRAAINKNPKLKEAYDLNPDEIDNYLRAAPVLNEQTVMGAIKLGAGDAYLRGLTKREIPENKDLDVNPTLRNNNNRENKPKLSERDKMIKSYVDNMTESDRKICANSGRTPEQMAAFLIDGGLEGQASMDSVRSSFAKAAK